MEIKSLRVLGLIVILIGFSSIFSQSLLIRELIVVFYGNELIIGVILASWLFWTGMGSLWAQKLTFKRNISWNLFYSLYILFSLSILGEFFLIRNLRVIFHFEPGEIISPFSMFFISVFVFLPFALINGFLFFLCIRIFSHKVLRNSVGLVYALDSWGDMLGGIFFSFFFVFLLTPLENLYMIFIINIFIILFFLIFNTKNIKKRIFYFLLGPLLLINSFSLSSLEKFLIEKEWQGFNVVDVKNSYYGNFHLTKYKDSYTLYENGLLSFTFPFRMDCEEAVHFTFLQSANIDRILVIGEGLRGLLYEILKYPVKEVYYLELDPALICFIEKYLPYPDKNALYDSRVKIINLEARRFLNNYKGNKFDIVMLNSPFPYTAYLNRFYTYEFFLRVKRILSNKGVFSFALPSKEDYLTKEMRNFNASIYHTLKKVFPHILLVPGDKLRFVASSSSESFTYDDSILWRRLKDYKIKTEFVNKYYFKMKFLPWHINYVHNILANTKVIKLNYDFNPIGYYYGMELFISHFRSFTNVFLRFLMNIKVKVYFLFVFIIVAAVWVIRKKALLPLSVFSMGASGMGAVILSILGFQIVYGYVYHKIGIISASFMLGAALGAYGINRKIREMKLKGLVYILFFGSIFMVLLPYIFKSFIEIPLITEGIALILPIFMGFLVGFSFPLVNKLYNRREDVSNVGFLYFCDLAGGAVAGVMLSFIFIPLYGLFISGAILGYMLFICGVFLCFIGKE